MGSSQGADRRKYHRIATDQVISYSEVDRPELLAKAKDLSTGGIRFEAVGVEINLGEVLEVTFNVGDRKVVATGTVVWAIDTDPLTQEIGIQFWALDEEIVELLGDIVGAEYESADSSPSENDTAR